MLESGALRSFESVVRTGCVSAAAADLQLTPSAVSQQISRLERRLGLRLFHRSAQGMQPSADARRLLPEVITALGAIADVEREAQQCTQVPDHVCVGVTPSADPSIVFDVVHSVADRFPDAKFEIRTVEPASAPDALRLGDIDVVVGDVVDAHGIEVADVWTDGHVAVVRDDHRCADLDEVTIDDLRGSRLIVTARIDDPALDAWMSRSNFDGIETVDRCADAIAALSAVSLEGSVAIVGGSVAERYEVDNTVVRPIVDGGFERIVCAHRLRPFPIVSALVRMLQAVASNDARSG